MLPGPELMRTPLERRHQWPVLRWPLRAQAPNSGRVHPGYFDRTGPVHRVSECSSFGRDSIRQISGVGRYCRETSSIASMTPECSPERGKRCASTHHRNSLLGDIRSAIDSTRLCSAITAERICCMRLEHAMGSRRLHGQRCSENLEGLRERIAHS
jgi:hypothetical protein